MDINKRIEAIIEKASIATFISINRIKYRMDGVLNEERDKALIYHLEETGMSYELDLMNEDGLRIAESADFYKLEKI